MPIWTTCPRCKAIFRLDAELAGRKVKCQKCEGLFVVPQADADTLAPGTLVPGAHRPLHSDASSPAAPVTIPLPPATFPPPRLDDVPVTAKSTADEDETSPDEDRAKPEPQPRSSRRQRYEEQTRPRSSALPIVLALLGIGLLGCIGLGGVGLVWHFVQRKEPARPRFVNRNRGFPQNNFNQVDQEAARLAAFVPAAVRKPAPTSQEIKLGPDGTVRVESTLAMNDPKNADGRRHKAFAIKLEAGKRYQIDMAALNPQVFDTLLILADDANNRVDFNDDIVPGNDVNSRIFFTPDRTAVYRIEATFWLNQPMPGRPQESVGPFNLIVRELKN